MTESLQWHPVAERMPGAGETVIFWFVDWKGRGDWSAGYYFDGEWSVLFDRDVVRGTVTHWAQPKGPQ